MTNIVVALANEESCIPIVAAAFGKWLPKGSFTIVPTPSRQTVEEQDPGLRACQLAENAERSSPEATVGMAFVVDIVTTTETKESIRDDIQRGSVLTTGGQADLTPEMTQQLQVHVKTMPSVVRVTTGAVFRNGMPILQFGIVDDGASETPVLFLQGIPTPEGVCDQFYKDCHEVSDEPFLQFLPDPHAFVHAVEQSTHAMHLHSQVALVKAIQ